MEYSESGAPIYSHNEPDREMELVSGNPENIEKIAAHIEQHIGPVERVFHEIISDMVHLDLHLVAPTKEKPWYTVVTSGMSDRPMHVPEGAEECRYSELLLSLPPDWPMDQEKWEKSEDHYWPIRLLKTLARFPHEYQTWLWALHTMRNGEPPEPYASNTEMSGVVLLPPLLTGEAFWDLPMDETKTISFHAVIPLHGDEIDLKLQEGGEALLDLLEKNEVCEYLEPRRPSCLAPKKKKGWFGFGKRN